MAQLALSSVVCASGRGCRRERYAGDGFPRCGVRETQVHAQMQQATLRTRDAGTLLMNTWNERRTPCSSAGLLAAKLQPVRSQRRVDHTSPRHRVTTASRLVAGGWWVGKPSELRRCSIADRELQSTKGPGGQFMVSSRLTARSTPEPADRSRLALGLVSRTMCLCLCLYGAVRTRLAVVTDSGVPAWSH